MRLALLEPDIPQNTGALLRLAACFGVAVDLIEPCGFLLDDRRLKRAVLDYAADLTICRHASWEAFLARRASQSRLILMTSCIVSCLRQTTRSSSAERALECPRRFIAPRRPASSSRCAPARARSTSRSRAIVLAEGLRQTGLFPEP